MKYPILLIITSIISSTLSAKFVSAPYVLDNTKCYTLKLSGSFKSNPAVLKRTLKRIAQVNNHSCPKEMDVLEFVSLLKQSQLYYSIKHQFKGNAAHVEIKEKWTLIPILKASSAAGTQQYVIGVYDPDFMGSLNEVGVQYESLAGNSSYVGWFRSPSFALPQWKFGIDVWSIMQNQILYDSDRNEIAGFSIDRKRVHSFAEFNSRSWGRLILHLQYENDLLSDGALSDDIKDENSARSFTPDERDEIKSIALEHQLDYIERNSDYVSGWSFRSALHGQLTLDNEIHPKATLEAQVFKALPFSKHSYLAIRSLNEYQSLKFLSQQFYLGSFDRLRGFLNSQIPARAYSLLNVEVRSPWVRNSSMILQNVLFADQAFVEHDGEHLTPASFGMGFRLIFPKIYRLNLRVDYGYAYTESVGSSFSLGLQHFF